MERSAERAWNRCLTLIKDDVGRRTYKTWFEPLKPTALDDDDEQTRLTVEIPSRFYYEWLEAHYCGLINQAVTEAIGPNARLSYVVNEELESETGDGVPEGLEPSFDGNDPGSPSERSDGARSGRPTPPGPATSSTDSTDADPASPGGTSSTGPSTESGVNPADAATSSIPERGTTTTTSEGPSGESPGPGTQNGTAPSTSAPSGAQTAPSETRSDPEDEEFDLSPNLSPRYTFGNFIEGGCNRLARSSAFAIAQNPGETSFNPFLVYGAVGLGKTHLVQAIGNYARTERDQPCRVRYVSGERFTTEFVRAIQENKIAKFSAFYREIDLLIVDDVQFFGGKEKTQEEFFHLFNSLHQNGKQIVLCADRQPQDIPGIEERLLSRFQWGLTADVQAPQFETRVAILQCKMQESGVELPMDVVEFVARHITRNIRALEGAVNRLKVYAQIHDCEITIDLAQEVLRDLVSERQRSLSMSGIRQATATFYDVSEEQLQSRTRTRQVVQARQVAMYLCREYTEETLRAIGRAFGDRDHSTVIHSVDTVEDLLETDPNFRQQVEDLRHQLETGSAAT